MNLFLLSSKNFKQLGLFYLNKRKFFLLNVGLCSVLFNNLVFNKIINFFIKRGLKYNVELVFYSSVYWLKLVIWRRRFFFWRVFYQKTNNFFKKSWLFYIKRIKYKTNFFKYCTFYKYFYLKFFFFSNWVRQLDRFFVLKLSFISFKNRKFYQTSEYRLDSLNEEFFDLLTSLVFRFEINFESFFLTLGKFQSSLHTVNYLFLFVKYVLVSLYLLKREVKARIQSFYDKFEDYRESSIKFKKSDLNFSDFEVNFLRNLKNLVGFSKFDFFSKFKFVCSFFNKYTFWWLFSNSVFSFTYISFFKLYKYYLINFCFIDSFLLFNDFLVKLFLNFWLYEDLFKDRVLEFFKSNLFLSYNFTTIYCLRKIFSTLVRFRFKWYVKGVLFKLFSFWSLVFLDKFSYSNAGFFLFNRIILYDRFKFFRSLVYLRKRLMFFFYFFGHSKFTFITFDKFKFFFPSLVSSGVLVLIISNKVGVHNKVFRRTKCFFVFTVTGIFYSIKRSFYLSKDAYIYIFKYYKDINMTRIFIDFLELLNPFYSFFQLKSSKVTSYSTFFLKNIEAQVKFSIKYLVKSVFLNNNLNFGNKFKSSFLNFFHNRGFFFGNFVMQDRYFYRLSRLKSKRVT